MWDHIDFVTGMKKAPDRPARQNAQLCCRSTACEEISDREKHYHREGADHEDVTHVMPGNGTPRFGGAFNDAVVFHPRHKIAP
jgi:hypothetical protein